MDTPCICGVPERYAGAPAFPIEHDIILNEYSIAYGTPGQSGILRMRFCFFCGGNSLNPGDRQCSHSPIQLSRLPQS